LQSAGAHLFILDVPGFASTEIGPFDFEQGWDVDDIELSPQHAGRIVGRVLLPEGADGEGFILALNSGNGEPRTLRAGPGGRYKLEDLAPGWWQLSHAEEEIFPHRSSVSVSVVDEPIPYEGDFWVVGGETTHFDVDLRDRGPCTLRGQLNGGRFDGWSASLDTSMGWLIYRASAVSTSIVSDGSFEISVPLDGTYQILLTSPGDADALHVREQVELVAGDTTWSLDVLLGAVEGTVADLYNSPTSSLRLRWIGPRDSIKSTQPIVLDPSGAFRVGRVPQGRCAIDTLDSSGDQPIWRTVSEFDVVAGETLRVDLD